jgi:hypothetical protein
LTSERRPFNIDLGGPVFNARKAFRPLNGKSLAYPMLRRELFRIRRENLANLPPEFDIQDLFLLAVRKKWLKKGKAGRLTIEVS